MKVDEDRTSAIIAKNKERELRQNLEKISKRLIRGNDDSVEALYRLKGVLDRADIFDLAGKINPRLVSIIWFLDGFIRKLWGNMGYDSKGFPKTEGMKILQNIAKHLGIFIQTSLFRNRPRDSIGTFEDIINSYYELLRLAEESYRKGIPPEEFAAL